MNIHTGTPLLEGFIIILTPIDEINPITNPMNKNFDLPILFNIFFILYFTSLSGKYLNKYTLIKFSFLHTRANTIF